MTHHADSCFDALLEHAPFLRRLARGLVRDEARADDLVQDTWAVALRRPPRDPSGARGWLAAVARRLSLDHAKAEGRRSEREVRAARHEAQPPGGELDERVELARQVLDAVQALKEPYRGAIWLRYYDGLAPRAIARKLGVPVETVNTRLRRGKEQLRSKLDAQYGERRHWLSALTGLAALREPGLVTLATGAPAVAAGLIALPLVVAGALLARPGADEPPAPAAPVLVALSDPGDEATELGSLPAPKPRARDERAQAAAPARVALETHAPAAAASLEPAPTRVTVSTDWVVRAPDGPVHVGLLRAVAGRPVGSLLTEASGAPGADLELEVQGGGEVVLVAVAAGVKPITAAIDLPATGHTSVRTVVDDDEPAFSGRLVRADGAPVASMRVIARNMEPGSLSPDLQLGPFRLVLDGLSFRLQEEAVETGPHGELVYRGIGRGAHWLQVLPTQPEGVAWTWLFLGSRAAQLRIEVPGKGVEVVLHQALHELKVVDERGALDGVYCSNGSYAELAGYAAGRRTDEYRPNGMTLTPSGRLTVGVDPRDDQALYFERAGHAPALLRLATAVPDSSGVCVVRLPRSGATAALRIALESDGAPVTEEVVVRLHEGVKSCEQGPPLGRLERRLSPLDGVVYVEDVPPGGYSVDVRPVEGSWLLPTQTTVDLGPAGGALELQLERGGLVELVPARDAVGDEPLALRFHGDADEELDGGWIQAAELRAGRPLRVARAIPAGEWFVELTRNDAPRFSGRARVVAGELVRVGL